MLTTCAMIPGVLALAEPSAGLPGWVYALIALFGSPFLVRFFDFLKRREWSMQRTLGALQARVTMLETRLDRTMEENRSLGLENFTLKAEVNDLLDELQRPARYDNTGKVIILIPPRPRETDQPRA